MVDYSAPLVDEGAQNWARKTPMHRVASQSSIRRTQSVPVLAPVWEPDPDSIDSLWDDGQPPWTNTSCSVDGGRPFDPETLTPHLFAHPSAPHHELTGLSPEWRSLLRRLEVEACRADGRGAEEGGAARSSLELMAAAQSSMRREPLSLRLQPGAVEHAYTFKRELAGEGGRE
jgi:hypothetical protein|tara:strand:+ start:97 stop:615 length:519 start_codon:yes stop_codon:yes gene_type:complete